MDSKLREGDSLVDADNSAKKRFKFKSFKNFFVKKKRKESLPSLASSGLKQSQSAGDVTAPDSMHYDSEDDTEAAASVLGSRAVSHDSIFIPEMPEPARPIRIFSQENVSDRIKALQLRLHSNIRIGPPPFGMLSKRTEDPGTSSEDDGLPRSPPEMFLMHETIKTRLSEIHRHHSSLSLGGTGSEEEEQVTSETPSRPLSPEENELRDAPKYPPERSTLLSPSADFDTPPQFSTFLNNSAARHRLSVKPKNQRSSKMRRPSAALLEESVDGTNCMKEEDVTAPSEEQRHICTTLLTSDKDSGGDTEDSASVKSSEIMLRTESKSLSEESQNLANENSTLTPHSIQLVEDIRNPEFVDESPCNKQERFHPMLRPVTAGHSQESLQSRRGFRHSLTERGQNTLEQPLSDKENIIKLGSMDAMPEQSSTDTCTQRKFSVSSAWERPRTNSFILKTIADTDAPTSTNLSLVKPEVSKTENIKEEHRSAAIQTENKQTGRRKEILADLVSVPADKATSGTVTSNQSTAPAASDLSVATDTAAASDHKSPVTLRPSSLSVRYRDRINPVSMKRHSAEMKLEKTGWLPLSKDEICDVGHLPAISKLEMKHKMDSAEMVQTKPPLPRKPVLQNITSADNNMIKDTPENNSSQDKKSKPAEAKIEENMSVREKSVRKSIERKPSSVVPAEPSKELESKEQPSWMSIARQKQLSFKEEHPNYKQNTKSKNQDAGNPNERIEAHLKQQVDQNQSKKTSTAAAVVPETYGQDTNNEIKESRQRANTFSHPVHGTHLSLLTEKEEKTFYKRPTLSLSEEPSWMELAKKKSQAWSDMPQIIK
ncbi:CRACD-like protein [Gastrophryne carolinensis]